MTLGTIMYVLFTTCVHVFIQQAHDALKVRTCAHELKRVLNILS